MLTIHVLLTYSSSNIIFLSLKNFIIYSFRPRETHDNESEKIINHDSDVFLNLEDYSFWQCLHGGELCFPRVILFQLKSVTFLAPYIKKG